MKHLIAILFLLVFAAPVAKASHIVGGDFSLQHLEGDRYLLTLKVFRDCENGIPWFNEPLYVGMFEKGSNALVNTFRFDRIISNDTLRFVGDNCINIPDGCTQIGLYQKVVTFPASQFNNSQGYYFSWERCCRNVIIKNIDVGQNPQGEVGMAFYMEVPSFSVFNNTPVFNRDPLTLLCVNNPFTFNYNVTDADGDSLVYSLVEPLAGNTDHTRPNDPGSPDYPLIMPGPYRPITWRPGFGLNKIIDGNPNLSIDRQTGNLSITPTSQGVYVVAILVEEYRNGVKIGEVRRELQFTVSTCNQNAPPRFEQGMDGKVITAYAGQEICFPILTTDANPEDSMFLTFSGTIFGNGDSDPLPPFASIDVKEGRQRLEHKFCWETTCAHISDEPYDVQLTVVDNGCPIAKTTIINFQIVVKPPPLMEPPAMFCLDRISPDEVSLTWGRFDITQHFDHFVLMRRNPDGTDQQMATIDNPAVTSFNDSAAFNHLTTNYCYYMYGVNTCGSIGDSTYFVCTVPDEDSIPAATYVATATVLNNESVGVYWERADEPDFYRYVLERKVNHEDSTWRTYKIITNRDDTFFNDSAVKVATTSYCYRLSVEDQCGLVSQMSNLGCNIVLTGESAPFTHTLDWSPYIGWEDGVWRYELIRRDPATSPVVIEDGGDDFLHFIDDELNYDEGAYWYDVIAYEEGTEPDRQNTSRSNTVFLFQKPELYVPNAFSPNTIDDINDNWGIVPVFVKDYHLQVYNRWGELVFETEDKLHQWTGFHNGKEPFDNVFVYLVTFTGWDHSIYHRKGTVTILR